MKASVVIDISTFEKPKKDSPEAYETRCIKFDAERAAKMGDHPDKACSWHPGSRQWNLWVDTWCKYIEGEVE